MIDSAYELSERKIMNYNHLVYFSTLAELEHYGKAAEKLGISQPTLSSAIRNMEEELGVFLFEKQGRNVRLTEYGREYRDYVDRALETLQEGKLQMAHCADRELGIVRIGAVSSAGPGRMLPILSRYERKHPRVRFEYMDGTSLTLLEELKEERYDLVIAAREQADPEIRFTPLWKQNFVAIVPPDHPLAARPEVSLEQLGRYPLIRYHSTAAARARIDALFEAAGVRPVTRCEVSDDFHIAGMVAAGLGVAVLVDSSMPDLYGLKKIPLKDGSGSRNLYLAVKRNRFLSETVQDFLKFLQQEFVQL